MRSRLPGVLFATALAAVAALLGARFAVIGGPVFGIVLGMSIRATGRVDARYNAGIAYSAKKLLQFAIILLGAGLSVNEIVTTGQNSLPVLLGTLIVCLIAALLVGRLLKVSSRLTTLIGVGTAICGASAIAAVSPVIEAEEEEVAYAVSTIFCFNVLAVLLFPPVGRLLEMSQEAFGLWAGTAVNDTSSVVAAAYAYGLEAGAYATIVKLTRSIFIIPITLAVAGWRLLGARHARNQGQKVNVKGLIPWFIVWFLVAALVNSTGLLPRVIVDTAAATAKFLIIVALTAVGLSADFRQMARAGMKPLGLGLALWAVMAVSCLLLQRWTGSWT